MTKRDEAAEEATRHLQEIAERDRARRREDTSKGGAEHDPRETTEPPQPFSGSEH
ncbi:hypothetical protein [Catelliglobosispora koreensis]|jgi:hypothetical protein|uniref:hypothetical protein n=1 Tax=Catelliglobosispora koreensis TaxID=129052 RepID=UPI0003808E36|nr:hypothetical protein [Catelliglobosispora koreensis]